MRFWLAGLASALLAGCASTHDLKPHAQLLKAPPTQKASTSFDWPQDDWWRQFGDRQLDALVERATADNPDLQQAQSRVARAEALTDLAHSGFQPQISANASAQRMHFSKRHLVPPPYAGHSYWDNTATLDLSWDLDLWGRQRHGYLAQLARAQAAALEARETCIALQTAVVRSYIKLFESRALRKLARTNLQREQQLLDIAKQRYAAGMGTQLEVSQASTALPDTRATLARLDARITVLGHQLAALSGQPPDAAAQLRPPQLSLTNDVSVAKHLPADLLGHRPDIIAHRLRVAAASQDIQAAKARFFPDINLAAAAGFAAMGFGHLLSGDAVQYGVTPAISLPIFSGGRLRSQLRGADADYDSAVAAYNATLLHALQQTADVIAQLRALHRQSREVDLALADARHAWRDARSGYQAGLTNQLAVLVAQASLLQQQRNRVQLDAQRLDRYAQLMQALGGGFSHADPPNSSARLAGLDLSLHKLASRDDKNAMATPSPP